MENMNPKKKATARLARVCAAFLLIGILLVSSIPGMAAYAAGNENVKESVVPVIIYFRDAELYYTPDGQSLSKVRDLGSEYEWASGSGFFIGKSGQPSQYIVTNCHVVEDYVNLGEGDELLFNAGTSADGYPLYIHASSSELRVYFSDNDYEVAYVDCYGDTNKVDLAVIRLREPTDKRRPLKIQYPTKKMEINREPVYAVGFPGNADNEFTGASHYNVSDASITDGIIEKFAVNDGKGVERLQISAKVHHGNSGGPLVTKDNNVIGINTNVISNSPYTDQIEADYYAISSTELTRFLDRNNIAYEMAGGGLSIVWIIVIVVVVVAVIAVVLVLALRKGKGPAADAGAGPVGTGAASPRGGQKHPVLRGLNGKYSGQSFDLSKGRLVIGRDPASCNIVYDKNAPGISGRHCQVAYDFGEDCFIITDLGSSYGTFLGNGKKLTANVAEKLAVGDSFYLCDNTNRFVVTKE